MKAEVAYELKVGDIVMLYKGFLDSKAGDVGIIYELYKDFYNNQFNGVSVIMQHGIDLGGFSFTEQQQYLEYIRSTDLQYKFVSVMKLHNDFKKGVFKKYFL